MLLNWACLNINLIKFTFYFITIQSMFYKMQFICRNQQLTTLSIKIYKHYIPISVQCQSMSYNVSSNQFQFQYVLTEKTFIKALHLFTSKLHSSFDMRIRNSQNVNLSLYRFILFPSTDPTTTTHTTL